MEADNSTKVFTATWTSVSEKMPEATGHYLVTILCFCTDIGVTVGSWMQIAWFYDGKFFWEHLQQENQERVTHWMPLPEPAEEGE